MAIDRIKVKKEADKLLAAGKVDKAVVEYRRLLEDNPKDLNLMNQLGDICLQAGRNQDAVEYFKKAGMGFERDGFSAKATAVFKKAVKAAPEDMDLAQRLADLYRQTGLVKEAVSVHMQVAEHFTKKGLIKRALDEFAKVVDLDPKNLKNKIKLADLYNKEGMKDRSASIYLEVAEALAIDQKHAEAHQILDRVKTMITSPQVFLTQSRLSVIQGDLVQAAQHLREGLEANNRSPELLEALAEIEMRAGHPDRVLEALAQVPQPAEKSLGLAEKAMRQMAQAGRPEEALRLFQPIGRDLARRGSGDSVGRSLRTAFQNNLPLEGWMQLAEVAHQGGRKDEQAQALQAAYGLAQQQNNQALMGQLAAQLQALGLVPGASAPPPPPPVTTTHSSGPLNLGGSMEGTRPGTETEIDPVKRLKVEQLVREAEALGRSGSPERAAEAYRKALDLDPANLPVIEAIVAIHRASGMLTRVQMQYVQSAQTLATLGKKREAMGLLDKAEALFPGSTRMHRRTLGLADAAPVPSPEAIPAPPPAPSMGLDPLISLDMPGFDLPSAPIPLGEALSMPPEALGMPAEALSMSPDALAMPPDLLSMPGEALPPAATIALGGGLAMPDALAMPPDAFAHPDPFAAPPAPAPALGAEDLDWASALAPDFDSLEAPPSAPIPAPLPDDTGVPEFDAASLGLSLPPAPPAPPSIPAPAPAPAHVEIPAELTSLLSDIDFQLDYGSPEEAKLEIEAALRRFPDHPELTERLERVGTMLTKLGHAPVASGPASGGALIGGEDTNSFFDLTDVLGDALMDSGEGEEMHDATRVVEKVQSVEELFSAFRDGVEKQVKADDFDTHYNLGIAYKEMMLIEPAMEEFKIAMRDPERTLECCSMLSICEQAQGNFDEAISWLQRGIGAPGFPPEDSIGLRYDLGELYLQQGHVALAQEEYRKVYEMDPEYREVAAKLS